jgi:hypothetical protein
VACFFSKALSRNSSGGSEGIDEKPEPRPPLSGPTLILENFRNSYHEWFFFLILVCEAIGTAATPGLLCQPRVIVNMIMEKQMECRLAEETEVLGENLLQHHICPSQNPT